MNKKPLGPEPLGSSPAATSHTTEAPKARRTFEPMSTFGPHLRIRHKRDFERLQRQGRKLYATHFLIVLDKAETPHSRIALAVTKKVEPRAVIRNKLRRRLKEIFRLTHTKLTGNFDILIIARKDAQQCEFAQVKREVLGALHHAGLLRQ